MIFWLKQADINIWNRELKAIFYLWKSFFLTRDKARPSGKYSAWPKLFKSPRTLIFSDAPFSKFGTESFSSPAERGGLMLCIHHTYTYKESKYSEILLNKNDKCLFSYLYIQLYNRNIFRFPGYNFLWMANLKTFTDINFRRGSALN